MMLRIMFVVGLLTLLAFAQAQVIVDRSNCYQRSATKGWSASCNPGFVAIALCTSGQHADCHHNGRSFTVITCCKVVGATHHQDCQEFYANKGVSRVCQSNQAVTQVCSSGKHGDCGYDIFTRINCCNGMGLSLSRSGCIWSYGGNGRTVTCGHNSVIAGVCTSGKLADCRNHTGIYCCPLNPFRRTVAAGMC